MTGAHDWAGTVGDMWAAEWRRTDRSLADLSRRLDATILATAPDGPFRALDIGCGAGGTSLVLAAARPDAAILGIDLSAGLVAVARERLSREHAARFDRHPGLGPGSRLCPVVSASGTPVRGRGDESVDCPSVTDRRSGLQSTRGTQVCDDAIIYLVGDAATAAREHASFDLLYSRHGVMFFDDPVAAFAGLRAAAGPGARLVFSCFADWSRNSFAKDLAEAIGSPPPVADAPGPFALQDADRVAALLAAAGWRDAAPALVPFTYRAGEGEGDAAVADALAFFQRIGPAASMLRAALPAERAGLIDRVTAVLRDRYTRNAVDFPACAWIWSATA